MYDVLVSQLLAGDIKIPVTEIKFITPQISPGCPGNVIDNVLIIQLLGSDLHDGTLQWRVWETLYTCNILLIKISFSATLLYGDSMQVPILWHAHVYVHSSTLMHACIYVSTKWLLEVRSDYVYCKVHWLLLHWYCWESQPFWHGQLSWCWGIVPANHLR